MSFDGEPRLPFSAESSAGGLGHSEFTITHARYPKREGFFDVVSADQPEMVSHSCYVVFCQDAFLLINY